MYPHSLLNQVMTLLAAIFKVETTSYEKCKLLTVDQNEFFYVAPFLHVTCALLL